MGVRRPNQPWRWPPWLISSEADLKTLTTLLSHNEQPVWAANDEIEHYFEKLVGAAAPHLPDGRRLVFSLAGGARPLLDEQQEAVA